MLLEDKINGAWVGGAYPCHFCFQPALAGTEDKYQLQKELDKFTGLDATQNLATKVKLATISFQWTMDNNSHYLQIAAPPQTTNETLDFNSIVVQACVKAQDELRKDCWSNISFLSNTNDGISSDGRFTRTSLTNHLNRKTSNSCHTDPNHNVKNA